MYYKEQIAKSYFIYKRCIILEEVIKKIIDIENRAKSIIKDTQIEKDNKYKNMETTIEEMKKDLVVRSENKITELKIRALEEAEKIAKENIIKTDNKIMEIEEYAKNNIDKWVDEIYSNIIT